MKDRQIYRYFGLMDDSLSSISHVFASGFVDGASPRTLNLHEIEAKNYWPKYSKIYLFENPSVFSYLVLETTHFLIRMVLYTTIFLMLFHRLFVHLDRQEVQPSSLLENVLRLILIVSSFILVILIFMVFR